MDYSLISQMAYATSPADLSLVSQIAYERLCDGDPDKALDFVLECVPEMPEDLALQIVTGHAWLKPAEDGMVNFTTERPEGYFKTPDMAWLLQHRMDDMQDTLKCMLRKMSELKELDCIEDIKVDNLLVSDFKYAHSMMKDRPSQKAEEWYCDIWDEAITRKPAKIIAHIIYLYKNMQYFIRDYKKSYKLWSWGRKVLHIRPVKDAQFFMWTGSLLKDFFKVNINDNAIKKHLRKMTEEWESIIEDDDILKKAYDGEFLECDIMDGYDAGWLSPEGKYYGADGDTGALLHIAIAEKLKRDDRDLEMDGWVKIHHNACYGYPKFWKDKDCSDILKNPDGTPWNGYVWTDTQLKLICDYIDKFYNGCLMTEPFGAKYFQTSDILQMDIISLHEALT